jgi:hypothetical protein
MSLIFEFKSFGVRSFIDALRIYVKSKKLRKPMNSKMRREGAETLV